MPGGLPNRRIQMLSAVSGDRAISAPRLSRAILFFLLLIRADFTPCAFNLSKIVGDNSSSALSIYSSLPLSARKELPVMPFSPGKVPQQIDALLALVTVGISAFTGL